MSGSDTSDPTRPPTTDPTPPTNLVIRQARDTDLAAAKEVVEKASGPGRYALSAYRVREGHSRSVGLCQVAEFRDRIVGVVHFTAVEIGGCSGALLLGPLSVLPEYINQGIGGELIKRGATAARAAGYRIILLVGNESYYGRFGFRKTAPRAVRLPGPADPARILFLELQDEAASDYNGLVTAD